MHVNIKNCFVFNKILHNYIFLEKFNKNANFYHNFAKIAKKYLGLQMDKKVSQNPHLKPKKQAKKQKNAPKISKDSDKIQKNSKKFKFFCKFLNLALDKHLV